MNIECDANGNYFFNGNRMLVNYIRGDWIGRINPKYHNYNPYEPELVREWYPGVVGVCVAFLSGDRVRLGYSKCNILQGDHFDRKRGINMAVWRALMNNIRPPFEGYVPAVAASLDRMYYKALNHFHLKDEV